ncbi:MAG TPA: hypothetical protein VM433_05780 [Mycobacteriales bacterium]|nr:hypothetical protein [Mycobacteriales bacterium]
MTSENDDLTADEGVNEGSADSTEESGGAGVAGALAAASETGRPKDEYDPAPPLDTALPQTRTDEDGQTGPGQELSAGEG